MNSERVWRIITEDLEMRKICATMVPRLLNEGQKEWRVQVCQDILEHLETEPNLLKRVVVDDESWIFEYTPLIKWQSLERKSALSPSPKKARVFKSKTKVMLIAFFSCLWNCPCRILATRPNYQSACLQKHLATSDVLSEEEKKRTVGNKAMAASS